MEFFVYLVLFLWGISELSINIKGEDVNSFGPQQTKIFDVTTFGALGDGKTDDSQAFENAWKAACQEAVDSVKISVPIGKTFLVFPIEFGGPCKSHKITFEILGSIVAQPKLEWKSKDKSGWLKFEGVDGLSVVGNEVGLVDGQGLSWWQTGDKARPTAMMFGRCNNLQIMGLRHINSQKFHLSISECNNTIISKLQIMAPQNSPNTDGIDIFSSTNVTIHNCTIGTGDDCIAIKGGTSNLNISEIACGPGHGISIGSLGPNGKRDEVEAININNCTINGTENGVRIKTWQGGAGFARNINFSNIIFIMADNPIVIDQFYCPHNLCSKKIGQTSAVNVSNVRYNGLRGTSAVKNAAISFRCSDAVPCTNIIVEGVDITSSFGNKPAKSECLNAHGIARNVTSPPLDCLLK